MEYNDFLRKKAFETVDFGFTPESINANAKDHQKAIVEWACKRGRAAIFADTGLGKTFMQLEWASQVSQQTNKPVLLLAPLAVGKQTEREASKFNILSSAKFVTDPCTVTRIQITNYEMLKNFDPKMYSGIVLDESSILKGQTGAYRKALTEFAKDIPYRLSCTATPSPNDFMELGTQAEFLGIMSQVEMLAMFFTHDGSETQKWRLKGHGASKFWDWLATWAVVISSPADLGYDGSEYDLPELDIVECILPSKNKDTLIADVAMGLSAARIAKKSSVDDRVKACADWVNSLDEQCLVWAESNEEGDKLEKAINDSVQVAGADKSEHKINAAQWFSCYDEFIVVNGKLLRASEWHGKKNTQNQEEKNITSVKKKGKKDLSNQKGMTAESICASTDLKTGKNGTELRSSRQKSTEEEERNTQKTRSIEKKLKESPRSTLQQTQKENSSKDSESTDLQLNSTNQFSNHKDINAQYADRKIAEHQEKTGCMLTTATQQAESEDCCASTAITESENSKTQLKSCQKRSATSKKVLISKSKIFGFGLNFQNSNKMAFVGATYSFEQFYQAVRRQWRFGQTKPVEVRVYMTEEEVGIHAAMMNKMENDKIMRREMIRVMSDAMKKEIFGATQEKASYVPVKTASMPGFL